VRNTPVFTIGDLLQYSPGISIKQGNGPRDVGISIRGSNARNGFGVRNIVVEEDGFPVSQPDGLSRTDLIDPHAYGAVDVYRGPSSALFGNYATGGAINFRMRTGAEIMGAEAGTDVGSFRYLNNYIIAGTHAGPADISIFGSDVRGAGYIQYSDFNTQTLNFTGRYEVTPSDRVTVKAIYNQLAGDLSVRLSLDQFYLNPFQHGCGIAIAANALVCGQVSVFANGIAGAKILQSADQAGLHRGDRRDIVGLRWEHDFDAWTTWRTQVVYDDRNINQPTGATTAIGDFPSINIMSDVTRRDTLFGFAATHFVQFNYNSMRATSYTDNVLPFSFGAPGATTNKVDSYQSNMGARVREEIRLGERWTGVLGLGGEATRIAATSSNFSYNAAGIPTGITPIPFEKTYNNIAPEAGLRFKPLADWQVRARVATGYGTPNPGQLFVTQSGTPGANTQLKPQTNLGYDAGVDWTPVKNTTLSVTGFYEFFRDEQLTQTPGAGLQAFTFNAPASVHRGVEVAADWRSPEGWRGLLAYTFNDQHFRSFVERLGPANFFDRQDNRIPGVAPHELTARGGYDVPFGDFRGFGAFAEYVYKSDYFIDNGNQLKVPSYGIVNLNVHYDRAVAFGFIKSIAAYFEVKNVFNKTYVASANNITNALLGPLQSPGIVLASTATGSVYAGSPRAFTGGVRIKF